MQQRPSYAETALRCGLPLVMLAVLALAPVLGGFGVLVCALALWKSAGVWL